MGRFDGSSRRGLTWERRTCPVEVWRDVVETRRED